MTAESVHSSSSKNKPKHFYNIFFNMPENRATENNLSDTPGNIFNTDELEYNQITNRTL